ncbi:hypothetical protein P7K49_028428 [Saguinus oedipus]|uniref:Uncharacterized protein n=1 Tax=Saguinus oedipus TaxID=9490 RepID=A0ABQ9UD29_SAGOE|nr:hypothetical protein P7K49_028428 [Saguinus oedipus]
MLSHDGEHRAVREPFHLPGAASPEPCSHPAGFLFPQQRAGLSLKPLKPRPGGLRWAGGAPILPQPSGPPVAGALERGLRELAGYLEGPGGWRLDNPSRGSARACAQLRRPGP